MDGKLNMIKNKNPKNDRKGIKNMRKIVILTAILSMFILMQFASASVNFFQQNRYSLLDNVTTSKFTSVVYLQDILLLDKIKDNRPFEFYVQYYSFFADWNIANPDNYIEYCNLIVNYLPQPSGSSIQLLNINITDNLETSKSFIRLNNRESAIIDLRCVFREANGRVLELPIDYSIVMPTWECKACQFYEWSKVEATLIKATTINDFVKDNVEFIKNLLILNYNNIIIIFWIFLILGLLSALVLVFAIFQWIYLYLKGLGKR